MENPLVLSDLPSLLLPWYEETGRDLPWRRDVTPYRVWVSEIMLQQTRVSAVLGYFSRFMEALPRVEDLAQVPEDALMKLWQGLGYYSRARNLQKAARQILEDFGGEFPQTYEGLRALAGVGDYTASAIASIVYGLPLPAVDGNLLRVTARLLGEEGDITTPGVKKRLAAVLRAVIPPDQPGAFNQAMMDLGAMVCLPNGAPLCGDCPVRGLCAAYRRELTSLLPVRGRKKPRRQEERVVYFLVHGGKIALRRRPERGLLAGLWEFPNELTSAADPLESWGLEETGRRFGGTGRHIFTHVEWHMTAWVVEVRGDALPSGWVWADGGDLQNRYALPSAFSSFDSLVKEVFACE